MKRFFSIFTKLCSGDEKVLFVDLSTDLRRLVRKGRGKFFFFTSTIQFHLEGKPLQVDFRKGKEVGRRGGEWARVIYTLL